MVTFTSDSVTAAALATGGVALAAGVASFASGYEVGLAVAAATSIGGAVTASVTLTPAAAKAGGSGGA